MSKLLRTLPLLTTRSKPLSLLPTTFLSLSSIKLNIPPSTSSSSSSANSQRALSTAPLSAYAGSEQTRASDPFNPVGPTKEPTLEWVARTALCGKLGEADVGQRVRLCGWVALHRVHGGLTFVNLRDHTGIVQITTLPDDFPEAHSMVNDLRLEYVIAVDGVVRLRPSEAVNKKMKTGMIEVAVEHVQVLNSVKAKLPFLVTTAEDAKDSTKEEIRLRYRCLDLRRHQVNANIMLRHRVVKFIRRYLEDVHSFVEGRLRHQCSLGQPLRVLGII